MPKNKSMTLMQACRDYFGLKEGQTGMQFGTQEFKALSDKDKEEIKAGLEASGYNIVSASGINVRMGEAITAA